MDELMIKIENVSKQYKLGQIGGTTLRDELQRKRAKLRGEEDPTKKIGAKDYKDGETFLALNSVSFEVKKGERVGIIGHNGAGKSTLLKLISRVTSPTTGAIGLNGRITSMLEVGTGFHGELTGRENIYMNGAILGMTKKEIDRKIEEIIDFSEVRQFIDTPVKRYSSGMYVKLAFSVAAHLDSEIMIMDEVLAVGDMTFQKKCLDKMNEVSRSEGRTILYVSHNMNTIRQLCERCLLLDHGRIMMDGVVEDAIDQYLGHVQGDSRPIFFDYSEKKRANHFGENIKINSFCIREKEEAIFEVGEKMKVDICFSSTIELKNAQIAFKLYDRNRYCLGMSLSDCFDIYEGNKQIVTIEVPFDVLVQNEYILNFEIIKVGANGYYYSYDNPAAQIMIKYCNEFGHGIYWNRDWFGTISLESAKVLKTVNGEK